MSKIEVNAIEPQSGTTLTLGASGDTVALAAGALQSGFGRSGSVNWDTTPKTSGFTAVSGNGYFVNTTSAAITVTLPITPTAGDIVAIADYANTSATNNITVGRNGSKIDGETIDATIKVNGQVYTLVYIDATEGWKTVGQTFNQITTAAFIAATGGTITTCGNYKIHTFTGPGTFTVTNVGNSGGSNEVSYMIVAGGGGGGYEDSGGGGAGGFREGKTPQCSYTASPLASSTGILVTAQGYPIVIGGGGAGSAGPAATPTGLGIPGVASSGLGISSAGGGGGGAGECNTNNGLRLGLPGGSGGGGAGVYGAQPQDGPNGPAGGTGNTPPVSPSQGFPGGNGPTLPRASNLVAELGGGGGGATQAGQRTPSPTQSGAGGAGGAGATTSISGSPTTYAGGGAGGVNTYAPAGAGSAGAGGVGGGGNGGYPSSKAGQNGTTNSGGGGGGTGGNGGCTGGSGGSGIVVIRYKFQ